MRKFYSFIREFKIPKKAELNEVFHSFSKKEVFVLITFTVVFAVTILIMLQRINNHFTIEVPASGGSLTEGVIGTPRFINPLLAISEADKDMTTLVYSGLMRKMPNGELIPDLAKSYEISSNGLIYTFHLKDKIYFQDNTPVTADDVVFTITKAKDTGLKSPRAANWTGVNAEKIDANTVRLTLKQPYASFLDYTTIGILPEHLWQNLSDEEWSFSNLNTKSIGSGPYKINSISNKSTGIPDYYKLIPFNKFALGKPYINNLEIKFYANEKDLLIGLENGEVESVGGIDGEQAEKLSGSGYNVESVPLPRIFGLFLNANQAQIFSDPAVAKAMNLAIDKNKIVKEILHRYGTSIDSPIPPNMLIYTDMSGNNSTISDNTQSSDPQAAKNILTKDGWIPDASGIMSKKVGKKPVMQLTFSISTGDTQELKQTAQYIKDDLAKIGIQVDIKPYEVGSLNQSVIRPRKYDALLFGQIISHDSDLYAFWHSSQRNDPGLNVSMYTSSKADKILESAITTQDENDRSEKYLAFADEIKKDMPAIFIYSPKFVYVVPNDIYGLKLNHITTNADRFNTIYSWYIQTDKIWKIFSK